MNDLISVIVPIYNVEKYLRDCITSIINQSYTNLQIILVNDGSKDNCINICKEYQKKDNRIIIIDKSNGGLSDARNAGIKMAKGKFICFIDSDDVVNRYYIEYLYNALISQKAQIAICKFGRFSEIDDLNEKKDRCNKINYNTVNNITACEQIYNKNYYVYCTVVWNKLYRKTLFDKISFPNGRLHEDEFTSYKLLYSSSKIVELSNQLYYYRFSPNSIMNKKINKTKLDVLDALNERLAFFEQHKENKLYNLTLIRMVRISLRIAFRFRYIYGEQNQYYKESLKSYYKHYDKAIRCNDCDVFNKIYIRFAKFNIDICYRIFCLLKGRSIK